MSTHPRQFKERAPELQPDHDTTRGLRSGPSPEDVARSYYLAHGDFYPEPERTGALRKPFLLGFVAVVILVVLISGFLFFHNTTPSSSATPGSTSTTIVTPTTAHP